MLFTYTYINHDIEKLQKYLDFIFFEVWCKAKGTFDAEKLAGHPELQQIYIDLGNIDENEKGGKSATFFNGHLEKIYAEFLKIDDATIERLKEGYRNNNNIEGLCNDKSIQPMTYKELAATHPDLTKLLKSFYGKLYGSESPFNLKAVGQLKDVLLKDHYEQFMNRNKEGKCPFCGLSNIKGNNHSFKDAYCHYLPKAIYPFNPLNFMNLAPMCNECNSTYKKTKIPIEQRNPLIGGGGRQIAFYPYSDIKHIPKFDVQLNTRDIENLTPNDLAITRIPENNDEQIASWMRVFGIQERYRALLCHPNEGKVWISSILDEYQNADALEGGITPEVYLNFQLRVAKRKPLSSFGFIKAPFLEACEVRGVFG